MIRRQLSLATAVLVVALWSGAAFAQEDSLLQRYDLALENLQVATASVPGDGLQARDELERALNALLTLSRDATSSNLVQAMERTFERTRVAVENQSRTDMAVQTAVLGGGFSRLVLDSAFSNADGDLALARGRLEHLARSLAFSADAVSEITSAGSSAALRLAFEAGAADAVAAELEVAARLFDDDRDGAYVSLAKAYGDSLLVQDSPRVDATLNRDLVGAAQALVAGDRAELDAATERATTSLTRLAAAARSAATDAGAADQTATQPTDEVAAQEPAALAPDVLPEVVAGAQSEPVAEEPATVETAETAATAAQPAEAQGDGALTGPDLEQAVAARLAEIEAEERRTHVDAVSLDLVGAGVPRALAGREAERVVDAGFADLGAVFTELDAGAGRMLAGVRRGDQTEAHAALTGIASTYGAVLAPSLRQVAPDVAQGTDDLLATLADTARLSTTDAALVGARTGIIRGAFAGEPVGVADAVETTVATAWSGLPRNVVYIVLALLAIVPLVLLKMAFGGSNRNWRLVGWALFLLLVPTFYQGIVALVDLLSGYVDMAWLPDLGRWSMFGGLTGQAVWAVLVLVALVLAIVGLRGICVQFGLLGGQKKSVAPPPAAAVPKKSSTGNTTIDWDEEF
ncbi:MAG: hypothetical protein IT345_13780 [Trueperaceae bacterium]|nr:hypothetical protein [Trueperaceae bacterium]